MELFTTVLDLLKTLFFIFVLYEVLVLFSPKTYRLYKPQDQCGDCKYVGYTDCVHGYLCCNNKIKDKFGPTYLHRTYTFRKGVSVFHANPKGECPYYKKFYLKWINKWDTTRNSSVF